MTPLDLARNLVSSGHPSSVTLGIAMTVRGLTDDDGLRQGWPLTAETVQRAAKYLLNLPPLTDAEVADVIATCPRVSDAMLNKGAATR